MKHKINKYWLLFAGLAICLLIASFNPVAAQPSGDWPQIALDKVTGGFESPVHLTHAGDGSGRLFVVEQGGWIRIVKNGAITATFLDISDRVRSPSSGGGGEEGLLSVAFPPDHGAGKDHFYVYYTNQDGDNQVSRFHLEAGPDTADPGSEELILLLEHPNHQNHNGGQLVFGPDGHLYIGTGDGGGGGDPEGNAQDPASLLGKLLRIDVEFEVSTNLLTAEQRVYLPTLLRDSNGTPIHRSYTIPPDNPFVGKPGYRGEIWALGLRNPWRLSFDRLNGNLYIGDVGQGDWEEVDFQPASSAGGENYGWNILEGFACYLFPNCDKTGLTLPALAYSHANGNCSVTGGYVYRGQALPQLGGIYLFADFCSGRLWGLQQAGGKWSSQLLLQTPHNISSFGEDQAGELYLADRSSGDIYKVVP